MRLKIDSNRFISLFPLTLIAISVGNLGPRIKRPGAVPTGRLTAPEARTILDLLFLLFCHHHAQKLRLDQGQIMFRTIVGLVVGLSLAIGSPSSATAGCLPVPGDINGTGVTNVADVQCLILVVLLELVDPLAPLPICVTVPKSSVDMDCDNQRNVNDVLVVITYGLQSPLGAEIDANGNQCPDTCENQCTGKPNGTSCDADASGCTQNDTCVDEICHAGPAQSCADGLGCTLNTCVSTGVNTYYCQSALGPGQCLIDGVCYQSSDSHPTNPCHGCTPSTSTIQWSPKADGSACDADGSGCTVGDSCVAGQCTPGQPADCDDGLLCTSDLCSSLAPGSYSCDHPVLNKTCLIAGVCYNANQTNPQNSCQICKSSVSKTTWTHANMGTPCDADGSGCTQNDFCDSGNCIAGAQSNCDDGISCTVDTCTSTGSGSYSCQHAAAPNTCWISGSCYAAFAPNPDNPCESCNPGTSQLIWTDKSNGTLCDADGNGCTVGDACAGGVCVAGAAPNCSDGKNCTADTCVSTSPTTHTCVSTLTAGRCLIANTCRNDGDANPTNPCEECAPALSTASWSAKPSGTACELTQGLCTVDTCVSGVCTATSAVNCDDGTSCTTDSCDVGSGQCVHTVQAGFCLIDGACYATNAVNSQNPCQWCKPGSNKTMWTSITNGTPCNADDNGCTTMDQCTSGICVPGTQQSCDDGLVCTTGSCVSTGPASFECSQKVSNGFCAIGTICFAGGDKNPANACQKCGPANSKTTWSPVLDGISCDADSNGCTAGDECHSGVCVAGPPADCTDAAECTIDVCSPVSSTSYSCSHTVSQGSCLIDGVCYAAHTPNPEDPCQRCKPAVSKTAWSASPDGLTCDADANGCTVSDTCLAGVCTPGDPAPCGDGLSCTTDVCNSTSPDTFVCAHTLSTGYCTIEGECFAQGTTHPTQVCKSCRPNQSTVGWSNKNNGVSCEKDNSLCTDDVCTNGNCETVATEMCNDSLSCTTDTCDPTTGDCSHTLEKATCLIDGACWPGQAVHPGNPCLKCKPGTSKSEWSPVGDGSSCDADSNGCTQNDTCQSGVCVAGLMANCSDGLGCTVDGCVSQNENSYTCTHTLDANKCKIDGECFPGGADNPDNPCQQCKATTSTSAWTAKNNGVSCNADNSGCTANDSCLAGVCTAGSAPNCGDNKACTTDLCTSTGTNTFQCSNPVKAGKCLIGGVCLNDGDIDPQNACKECAPIVSAVSYSSRPNGTECDIAGSGCTIDVCTNGQCVVSANINCNDGLACTADSCDAGTGGCINSVASNKCLIEGACWNPDAVNPQNPCQSCKPAASTTSWSNTANGTVCNADNDGCTVGDICSGGVCVAGGAAPCADSLSCTTDSCVSSGSSAYVCQHSPQTSYCVVNNTCYAAGEANPLNPCQRCAPSKSPTAFSAKADGVACNSDSNGCTVGDTCLAGVCKPGSGANCSDGLPCTDDGCQSSGNNSYTCNHTIKAQRCLISGDCYQEGEENPDNDCQHCKSQTNNTAFVNRNNSAACEADSDPCTDMDACFSGVCVASPPSSCDDDNACTVDSCVPFVGCVHSPVAIFVNAESLSPNPDGASWGMAYPTIRQALLVAQPGDSIFVAEGTYFYHPQPNDLAVGKMPVVSMVAGVSLYGGFVGTECSPTERAKPLALTTISADADKDSTFDTPNYTYPTDNQDNVVAVRAASDSVLDGFVLGGRGGPNGADPFVGRIALEVYGVDSFTIRNCTITSNAIGTTYNVSIPTMAAVSGVSSSSNILFENVVWTANTSSLLDGLLAVADSSQVQVRNCAFVENEGGGQKMVAVFSEVDGLSISGTRFWGNQGVVGIGMRILSIVSSTDVSLDDLTFYGNTSLAANANYAVWANNVPNLKMRGNSAWLSSNTSAFLRAEYGTSGVLSNSALFGATNLISANQAGQLVVEHSCYQGVVSPPSMVGTGNILLGNGANPFVVADQRLYLAHAGLDGKSTSTACIDAGSDFVAGEAGIPFAQLSTRTDGGLDTPPVDAGAHSGPCEAPDSAACAAVELCTLDSDCDDGLPCTTDTCYPMGNGVSGCVSTLLVDQCLIDGVCVLAGASKPASPCESCQPSQSTTSWTDVADGTACGNSSNVCVVKTCLAGACVSQNPCEDGLACTNHTCTAGANNTFSCGLTVANGTCFVGGQCYVNGDMDPSNPCKECKPATSKTVFSNSANGTVCESDFDPCTTGSKCTAGVCGAPVGTLNCDDQSACTIDSCVPLVGCAHSPAALFVDDDSVAVTPNGSSWETAFPTITAALAAVSTVKTIYVAEGMYVATTTGSLKVPPLAAKTGYTIVGGFLPGQCAPEERSFPLPVTLLTGDVNGDGVYTAAVDSTHTVQIWDDQNVVVDGFDLGGGQIPTSEYGAPVLISVSGSEFITLRNLRVSGHSNSATGGNVGAAVVLSYSDNITVEDSAFFSNTANFIAGGALGVDHAGQVVVRNCSFDNNVATHGAAVAVFATPGLVLENSTFNGNEGTGSWFYDGGAVFLTASDGANIRNCTFQNNISNGEGAGIYASSSDMVVSGCSFAYNEGGGTTGEDIWAYGTMLGNVENCAFFPKVPSQTSLGVNLNATLVAKNCCAPNLGGGVGSLANVVLQATADPFVVKGPRLYLKHAGLDGQLVSSACVDAGSSSLASSQVPGWTTQTTRTDGVMDTSPVDIGVHYVAPCAGLANGAACDDFDACTLGETCQNGICTAAVTQNCSDGLSCTADTCVAVGSSSFTCEHTPKAKRCVLSGACFTHGDANPGNECEVCDVDVSQSAWSDAPLGTLCSLDGSGCTVDVCAAGVCTPGANTACEDNLSCTTNGCTSSDPVLFSCTTNIQNGFCAIGGTCFAQNDHNPDNGCYQCKPATTKTTWTPKADGAACEGPEGLCVVGETCASGTCSGGTPLVCDDNNPCSTDSCSPLSGCRFEMPAWFVDVAAPGPVHDGQSWETAFVTIQDAVDAASSGDEIWVAKGEYWSEPGVESLVVMKSGIKLYGGFVGTECTRSDRPKPPELTRLIGDSDQDAVSETTDAVHLIVAATDTVIDGFYFGGTAGSDGLAPYLGRYGVHIEDCDGVTIRNATFDSLGYFTGVGGAAYVEGSTDILFTDCVMRNCDGSNGSAAYITGSDYVEFRGSTFTDNKGYGSGATLDFSHSDNAIIRDCSFSNNAAGPYSLAAGGALVFTSCAGAQVYNSTFVGNTAVLKGGAISADSVPTYLPTDLLVSGCSFYANGAAYGGAVYVGAATTVTVVNSAMFGNDGTTAGDELYIDPAESPLGAVHMSYSCTPVDFGGAGNVVLDPATENPFVVDGTRLYLVQPGTAGSAGTSPCVNAGSSLEALAAEISWKKMTTRGDGGVDITPIDMGAHYETCDGKTNGAACSDGDACTVSDACIKGECVGVAKNCDDGNSFTLDTCEAGGNCQHVPDCDDGDPCTTDTGEAGVCYHDPVAIFVDASAPGPQHDGKTWNTAFLTLTDAMTVASEGQQVFVSQGTYKSKVPNGAVLVMKLGVNVYGGFKGTECSVAARPKLLKATILDGDYDNSGTASAADSAHVVFGAHEATLDGFTIQGGANFGDSSDAAAGAGLRVEGIGGFVGKNLTVINNYTEQGPVAGVYLGYVEDVSLSDSTVSSNTTGTVVPNHGGVGGVLIEVSDNVVLSNVVMQYNTGYQAGALRAQDTAWTRIEDSTFRGNVGTTQSGAISLGFAASYTTIVNSTFYANEAATLGGALGAIYAWMYVKVIGCSFYNNKGTTGGAIYLTGSQFEVANTVFFGNTATTGVSHHIGQGSGASTSLTTNYCCSSETLTGTGNVLLSAQTGNPFTVVGSKLYLKHATVSGAVTTSACVNAGDKVTADQNSIDWSNQTTRADGVKDTSPVDIGVHYDP